MKKIVVTGGAGFIGSHLVKALVRGNNKVSVVDNFSTGRKENLQGVLKDIKLHRFDVRNFQALRKALQNVSCVFHLAAVSSVPLSVDDPLT
ncbi:MAG: NAD-dependent epimerase/dehydratase family protein, partial [Candidatus Zixiibacteriota bacterium]